jgi:uncharacterized flavoprotein (TIGR03862 family)
MAAEAARARGIQVHLYERKGSVGRKLLIAGKGGLNLTHSEARPKFDARYGERAAAVGRWLDDFDADALRDWARGLGVDTMIGTSGRVFPCDLKAAPLLRGWVRRLRSQGVHFHVEHDCRGIRCGDAPAGRRFGLRFDSASESVEHSADAVLLALGGASWPQLGSDGRWPAWVAPLGLDVAPLLPSNCGFEVNWSPYFSQRFAGQPLKPVVASWRDAAGRGDSRQGELMITQHGLEGGLLYALSAGLRDTLLREGAAQLVLDLAPSRSVAVLTAALAKDRGKRSLSEHWRRAAGLDALRCALLHEVLDRNVLSDAGVVAETIKALPLSLLRTRPIEEAISTAGGVRLESLDDDLMSHSLPGLFCAGEMLDWEAPTDGYLLTACFASGYRAGLAAAAWLNERSATMR